MHGILRWIGDCLRWKRVIINFYVKRLYIRQMYGHLNNCSNAMQLNAMQSKLKIRRTLTHIVGFFQLYYYFGMFEDLILRFGWTLSMSLVKAGYVEGELMMTILSPFEVFRRFIWNYFRLENEHLNNCGKFRAVRDISVAPMDCSDQVCLSLMVLFSCFFRFQVMNRKRVSHQNTKCTLTSIFRISYSGHNITDDGWRSWCYS